MRKNPFEWKFRKDERVDIMDMQEVIELVNTNRGTGRKESLNRMKRLVELIGNPQKDLKFIHIAGTNGKGSTSVFMEAILRTSAIKTGLYTSPHLVRLNERIRIDGREITDAELIETTETVREAVEQVEEELNERLYAFEILTAVAFLYFQKQGTELVILETGVGGRLDATNVIDESEVSIITAIGMDHMKVLGDTLEKITQEKAGIVKPNGALVTYPQNEAIEKIFEVRCREQAADWTAVKRQDVRITASSIEGQRFEYKGMGDFAIRMMGEHQVYNAVTAMEAVWKLQEKEWPIKDAHIKEGLEKAFWPGRMEKVADEPLVILDGAHNQQGVEMLEKNLKTLFPGKKLNFLVGMMQDKAYRKMIRLMEPMADRFLLLAPNSERALDAQTLKEKLAEEGIDAQAFAAPQEAAEYIRHNLAKEEIVVVFGSLYLVGDMKQAFEETE